MNKMRKYGTVIAGALAGAVTGLLGTGGGMVLVPLLTKLDAVKPQDVFAVSISITLPVSIVSMVMYARQEPVSFATALPYLIGCIPGAVFAVIVEKKIPVKWLHRILGAFILWGGICFLC